MNRRKLTSVPFAAAALACVTAMFNGGLAVAAPVTLGLGNIASSSNDTAFAQIVVDLNVTQSMPAGNYEATFFNYQITGTNGTVTPLVLVSPSANVYTVVAMGSTVTPSGPTSFLSAPFGGSSTFVLSSSTTIYGGFYWNSTAVSNPIGFIDGVGSVYSRYGGAAPPVVGLNIASIGGGGAPLSRRYDFSITVDQVVPEPGTAALFVALSGLALRRVTNRRNICRKV